MSCIDCRSDVITTEELEEALAILKEVSGEAKIHHLVRVLDEDHDGNINLEELAEVRPPQSQVPSLSQVYPCLLYTSPSPRDATLSRMPSSA